MALMNVERPNPERMETVTDDTLPSYVQSQTHARTQNTSGFPYGHFVLSNVLYKARSLQARTDGSLVLASAKKSGDSPSRTLYIDWSGYLVCLGSEGKAVDVIDRQPLLAPLSRPILPLPTPQSHPLPLFVFDPETRMVFVRFGCDPEFGDDASWASKSYVLEARSTPVPLMRQSNQSTTSLSSNTSATSTRRRFSAGLQLGGAPSWVTPASSRAEMRRKLQSGLGGSVSNPSSRRSSGSSHLFQAPNFSKLTALKPSSSGYENTFESDDDEDDDDATELRVVKLPAQWRTAFDHDIAAYDAAVSSPDAPREILENGMKWRRRQWLVSPTPQRSGISTGRSSRASSFHQPDQYSSSASRAPSLYSYEEEVY